MKGNESADRLPKEAVQKAKEMPEITKHTTIVDVRSLRKAPGQKKRQNMWNTPQRK